MNGRSFLLSALLRLNETQAPGLRDCCWPLPGLLPRHRPSLGSGILRPPSVSRGLCGGADMTVHHSLRLTGAALHQDPGSHRTSAGLALAVQLPSSIPPPRPVLCAHACAESGPATGLSPSLSSAQASWMPVSHPFSSIPGFFLNSPQHTQLLSKTLNSLPGSWNLLPTPSTPGLHKLQRPWQVFPKL